MNQGFRLNPHKGYIGSVNAEVLRGYYWGEIVGVEMTIEYTAETLDELQYEFECAVDKYLSLTGREV